MADPISFPSATPQFSLPLLFSGQAQKEFFLNQSTSLIDALMQKSITEATNVPPADAVDGSAFLVVSVATDSWAGKEGQLAISMGGAWHFVQPHDGMSVYDRSTGTWIHFSNGWQSADEPTQPSGGTTIDAEARQMIGELVEALRKIGVFPNPSGS